MKYLTIFSTADNKIIILNLGSVIISKFWIKKNQSPHMFKSSHSKACHYSIIMSICGGEEKK